MNSKQKLEALIHIKGQLEQWSANVPEWYFRLHGGKDVNIALQEIKRLIACATEDVIAEENHALQVWLQGSPDSLGVENIE